MAEIAAIIQALTSVVAVWLTRRTVKLVHLKKTTDMNVAVSAIERSEAQAKKRTKVDLTTAQRYDFDFVRDFKIVCPLRER